MKVIGVSSFGFFVCWCIFRLGRFVVIGSSKLGVIFGGVFFSDVGCLMLMFFENFVFFFGFLVSFFGSFSFFLVLVLFFCFYNFRSFGCFGFGFGFFGWFG